MSQYDRVEFFVAACIDDPIRPAKVERILVDVPIHPVGAARVDGPIQPASVGS